MKLQTLAFGILATGSTASPIHIASRAPGDRGSYTVSGLGSRKQAVLNAGGSTLDVAIAMLESDHMKADYAYG